MAMPPLHHMHFCLYDFIVLFHARLKIFLSVNYFKYLTSILLISQSSLHGLNIPAILKEVIAEIVTRLLF